MGRNAILKERKNDHFIDVGFGRGDDFSKCVFAITKTGLLCAFNDQRQLVKWIDLKVLILFCFTVNPRALAVTDLNLKRNAVFSPRNQFD